MPSFMAADILLPKNAEMDKWSVIACDQFTSDQDYWSRVAKNVGQSASTLNMILPEAKLGGSEEENHIRKINSTMRRYMESDLFQVYKGSYVYVERTLEDGSVRRGLVGAVDLEAYDYRPGSDSDIRATEKTVIERIPPRQRVRRDAPLEFTHVLLLCDDQEQVLLDPISQKKGSLKKLYDFDLMEEGGHISGWLVDGAEAKAFDSRLEAYSETVPGKYRDLAGKAMTFAVGDGNHSLATAKTCYEELKKSDPNADFSDHPARYALVELENIHDESQVFEPIHRVIFDTNPREVLQELIRSCSASKGFPVEWYIGKEHGCIYLDPQKGELAVAILQGFLDQYLKDHAGRIDYIHDDDELIRLSEPSERIGFLLPAMEKSQLFRGVIAGGVLPRKTFSMGHAREKRYYLEGRVIK